VTIDPKLLALARCAERGGACPPVFLATASHLASGTPVRSRTFTDTSDQPVQNQLWQAIRRGDVRRRERNDAHGEQVAKLREAWRQIIDAERGDEPAALTLAPAVIWGWGEGSGLKIHATRVPLAAVTSWWMGAGETIKGDSGSQWFLGVSVPIPS
jgi:hypothetical protein